MIFWNNLSRLNNLMIVMNISIFFLTCLVAKGYYYTFYSLICLAIVGIATLILNYFTGGYGIIGCFWQSNSLVFTT